MTRSLACALALGLLLVMPPAAARAQAQIQVRSVPELDNRAAVVFVDATGHAAETYFLLRRDYEDQPFYVDFSHNGPVQAGNGCQLSPSSDRSGTCTGFEIVAVDAGDGNDKVGLTLSHLNNQARLEAFPGLVLGGAGDDQITGAGGAAGQAGQQPAYAFDGGPGNDRLQAGAGEDYLEGGDGADTLIAKEGRDTVLGGPGDDEVSAGFQGGGDVLDGGDGNDRIPTIENNDYRRSLGVDVSVTQDGQANDGEPGEGDDVKSVEQLEIHGRAVTFDGTPGADQVFVNSSTSTLRGLAGNDRLIGYDGADRLEGGDGDDHLEGGFGNDVLDGGPGKDEFLGDPTERDVIAATGNDRVQARDGIAEQVNCGIGSDTATVDAADVVDASCESVDRAGGPAGGGANPAAALDFKLLGRLTLNRLIARGLRFEITCKAACLVTGELRYRRRKVGSGTRSLLAAGRARVIVKVPRRSRRTLERLRRAKLTLLVRVADGAGMRTTLTRSLSVGR